MGTRSITRVKEDGKVILAFYCQYDGYPDGGHGQRLAEYLQSFSIVNGLGADAELHRTANGMGCLAAQLIAELKTAVGNVYIVAPDTVGMGEEFEYTISIKEGKGLWVDCHEVAWDTEERTFNNGGPVAVMATTWARQDATV